MSAIRGLSFASRRRTLLSLLILSKLISRSSLLREVSVTFALFRLISFDDYGGMILKKRASFSCDTPFD